MSVATYKLKAHERADRLASTPKRTVPVPTAAMKEMMAQMAHMICRSAGEAEARTKSYRVDVEMLISDRQRVSYIAAQLADLSTPGWGAAEVRRLTGSGKPAADG